MFVVSSGERNKSHICCMWLWGIVLVILAILPLSSAFVSHGVGYNFGLQPPTRGKVADDRSVASPQTCTIKRNIPPRMSTLLEAPPSRMSDFERRMRNIAVRTTKRKAKRTIDTRKQRSRGDECPSNLQVVNTLQEYKAVVAGERERIVVVRFFATWCKACQAIGPAFHRLAKTYDNVLFVEVPVTNKNAELHQGLGVPSLPFGHIYHPKAGLVEELKISRKYFPDFQQKLRSYIHDSCDVPDGDCVSPYNVESLSH